MSTTTLVETVETNGVVCERHQMPNGDSCWYIDEHPTNEKLSHSYWRHNEETGKKGTRMAGVTTVVKPLDFKPDNLMKWAAKTQLRGAAILIERALLAGEADAKQLLATFRDNPDEGWQIIEAEELTFNDVRDQAADSGTKIHEQALRALAEGRPMPDLTGLTDREKGLAEAVHAFWFDLSPKVHAHEYVVCDPELGIAGRPDLLCELHLDGGPASTVVLDLKTGGYISTAHHGQVAGYRRMSNAGEFPQADGGLILQVSEDGTYRLIPVQATPEEFEMSVLTYRASGRIGNAARRARA